MRLLGCLIARVVGVERLLLCLRWHLRWHLFHAVQHHVEQVVLDVGIQLPLVLQQQALESVERAAELFDNVVGHEAVFGGVVRDVQWVQDDKVSLRGSVLEERAVVGDVDAEQLLVEEVAEVVQESHQQSRRRERRVHPHIPLVHVCHQQQHC